jgi:gamma-glutamylcyclotransferase (GGCT)/AIG2-like uncharacterized protein YtfP
MPLLFAYGTLLLAEVQQSVIGRPLEGIADALDGYRKTLVAIGDCLYADLEPEPSGTVAGRILTVTDGELARIDDYEGKEYGRRTVTLASGNTAFVYRTHPVPPLSKERGSTRLGKE